MSKLVNTDSSPGTGLLQAIYPGASQAVSVGASSVQSTVFQRSTSALKLYSTADCFIQIGINPTAVADSCMFLAAGLTDYFGVEQIEGSIGSYKLAVIRKSSSGTLYITEGL